MTLSIIIVSWRVREYLRNCLRSLFDGTHLPPDQWEIVVIDNASADGTVDMVAAEFPRVRCVPNPRNAGFGAANNQALPITSGRFVLLLNPDTEVPPGSIDRMVAELESRARAGVVGCRLLNTDGSFQVCSFGAEPNLLTVAAHFLFLNRLLPVKMRSLWLYSPAPPDAPAHVGWMSGACLLLRRSAIGGRIFDERYFMYYEDVELCRRLRLAGWEVIYLPEPCVIHHEGKSFESVSADVQLHKVRSLRQYLHSRYGWAGRILGDAFIVAGFSIRACFISLQCLAGPDRGMTLRRRLMFQFLAEAMRSFGAPVSS